MTDPFGYTEVDKCPAQRMIVRVQYSADGVGGWDLNYAPLDPDTGDPIGVIPNREFDCAAFWLEEMNEFDWFYRLRRLRKLRASLIRRHFENCADNLIKEIEARENWDKLLTSAAGGSK